MPTRGFLVLAVITMAAVIGCWIIVGSKYQTTAWDHEEGRLVFPELQHQVSKVAKIEVARAGGSFILERRGDGWANRDIGGFPARSAHVDGVIAALAGLKTIAPKTERSHLYPKLEVESVTTDAMSTRVVFRNVDDDVLADVIIGKPKEGAAGPGRHGVYIRLPGDEQAWLAEGVLDVRLDAADWSAREVVDIEAGALAELTVRQADGSVVALHRDRPDGPKLTLKNFPKAQR